MASILKLDSVRKSYPVGDRNLEVIKGINLEIASGDFVAIMGASGSGKTTLLHIMSGLDHPTSGAVSINGVELSTMNDHELAKIRNKTIGFVFQNFFLLNYCTALENVTLPLIYSDKNNVSASHGKDLLVQLGLGHRLSHRPHELSGGEKQRVAIARALINSPSVIFADEPTGALDSATGDSIMDLMEEIHNLGTTIVLITHDPKVAKRAKRVLHMSDGVFI